MSCVDVQALDSFTFPDAVMEYYEGQTLGPPVLAISTSAPKCTEKIRLIRKCGHREEAECWRARSPQVGCNIEVKSRSPVCGHDITISCRLLDDIEKKFWTKDTFVEVCKSSQIPKGAIPVRDIGALGKDMKKALRTCQMSTSRVLDCGHTEEVECASLLDILVSKARCEEEVTVRLACGHQANASCFDSRRYESGEVTIRCSANATQPCWNHVRCGRTLQVVCEFEGGLAGIPRLGVAQPKSTRTRSISARTDHL
jgi:hypothetical protein